MKMLLSHIKFSPLPTTIASVRLLTSTSHKAKKDMSDSASKVKQMASDTMEIAKDIGSEIKEKVKDAAHSTKEYLVGENDNVVKDVKEVYGQAKGEAERKAQELINEDEQLLKKKSDQLQKEDQEKNSISSAGMYMIIIAFSVLLLCVFVFCIWKRRNILSNYRKISQLHCQERDTKIKHFQSTHSLPPTTTAQSQLILSASVSDIVGNCQRGDWRVTDVVLIYCHEAAKVHFRLNCLTEINFENALKMAVTLDNIPLAERKKYSLFGVPISIKDNLHVAGLPSSAGVFKWRSQVMTEDSTIVHLLKQQGAIPFCKTNVPQTMMTFECANQLWGRTNNHYNLNYVPGGSSGGEGALISAGGSPLGIGSDIAGSLRIPAHFSGIFTIKPSNHRIPHSGCRAFRPASVLIHPVNGPMGRSVNDLVRVLEVVLGKGEDIDVPPSSLHSITTDTSSRKLRFGVISSVDFIEPLPPCKRALSLAEKALIADGHTAVPFNLPFPSIKTVSLLQQLLAADGGKFYLDILGDEPVEKAIKPMLRLRHLPQPIIKILGIIIGSLVKDDRIRVAANSLGTKSAADLIEMLGEKTRLQEEMARAWHEANIDFILLPAFATPATPHDAFASISFSAIYTFIWNIIDWVAGIVPITTVLSSDEPYTGQGLLESRLRRIYDPVKMQGLPVGVQIVTPQYKEREAIIAMYALEKALRISQS